MPTSELIYLASPYSHDNPRIREQRFNEVCKAAAVLMQQGLFVFSPIAHSHPIAQYGLPTNFEYWQKYNDAWMECCSKLFILTIGGWTTSKGIAGEILMAEKLSKPIYLLLPETYAIIPRV